MKLSTKLKDYKPRNKFPKPIKTRRFSFCKTAKGTAGHFDTSKTFLLQLQYFFKKYFLALSLVKFLKRNMFGVQSIEIFKQEYLTIQNMYETDFLKLWRNRNKLPKQSISLKASFSFLKRCFNFKRRFF